VEEIGVGQEVASRSELDPMGEVAWKAVEACFRRTGRVLHLHFPDEELIRTTPEHPFFVEGKGWTAAGSLKVGDRIATLSGEWVPISEVFDTEQWETVYNLRVADFHTYFVGDEGWGFAAWAHNDCTYKAVKSQNEASIQDVTSRRYVNPDETGLTQEKNPTNAHKYTLAEVDTRVAELNETLNDLVKVLTALPGVTEQLTVTQVKGLFQKYGGLTGTLNFTGFFLALVSAPSNGTTGDRDGRPKVEWDVAEPALAGLVAKYKWTMPERDKGDWREHQRHVTTLLKNEALGTGNQVGVQVQLDITYKGVTITTDADDLVLDPSDLTKGGVLVDAKFSDTYDLSNATSATLRSKLTKNQRIVWDWILDAQRTNNCANLSIVPKGNAAKNMNIADSPLPPEFVANLTLMLYVSKGVRGIDGIVPKTYS
jgi:hypothetical protein